MASGVVLDGGFAAGLSVSVSVSVPAAGPACPADALPVRSDATMSCTSLPFCHTTRARSGAALRGPFAAENQLAPACRPAGGVPWAGRGFPACTGRCTGRRTGLCLYGGADPQPGNAPEQTPRPAQTRRRGARGAGPIAWRRRRGGFWPGCCSAGLSYSEILAWSVRRGLPSVYTGGRGSVDARSPSPAAGCVLQRRKPSRETRRDGLRKCGFAASRDRRRLQPHPPPTARARAFLLRL